MADIKFILINLYTFRETIKRILRPYDFANLLRACDIKPREYERKSYLTPMNELFYTKQLYPIIDEEDIRIIVLGKGLKRMQIQLDVSSKIWNSSIRNSDIGVLVLVISSKLINDYHLSMIRDCIRQSDNIFMDFYCISTMLRAVHGEFLCIADRDFKFLYRPLHSYFDKSIAFNTLHVYEHNSSKLYNPFVKLSEYNGYVEDNLVSKYSNRYSDTYETCYITSAEMELGVETVYSKDTSISTDLIRRGTWNSIILVLDFEDLSTICNEIIATAITIPFTFSTF